MNARDGFLRHHLPLLIVYKRQAIIVHTVSFRLARTHPSTCLIRFCCYFNVEVRFVVSTLWPGPDKGELDFYYLLWVVNQDLISYNYYGQVRVLRQSLLNSERCAWEELFRLAW